MNTPSSSNSSNFSWSSTSLSREYLYIVYTAGGFLSTFAGSGPASENRVRLTLRMETDSSGGHVPWSWTNCSFFLRTIGSQVSFTTRTLPQIGVTIAGVGQRSGTELFNLGSNANSVWSLRSWGMSTSIWSPGKMVLDGGALMMWEH